MLLTYRLIKNHEGKISFTSTENVGTTFQLSFPIRSEHYQYRNEEYNSNVAPVLLQDGISPVMPVVEQPLVTARPDSPRILIVEDNASLRLFLMKFRLIPTIHISPSKGMNRKSFTLRKKT